MYTLTSPFEAIRCPALSTPPNAKKAACSNNDTESYNTACHFTCHVGYTATGSTVRRCLENGSWSGKTFQCDCKYSKSVHLALL